MSARRLVLALVLVFGSAVCYTAGVPAANASSKTGLRAPSPSSAHPTQYVGLGAILRTALALGPADVGRLDHITPVYRGSHGPTLAVLVEGNVRDADLRDIGAVVVGRSPNGALVARVPVEALAELAGLRGMTRVQCALKRQLTTDRAVPLAFGHAVPFDTAQLDRSVVGSGSRSLVAILDTGVDASHPGLRAADGSTRILGFLDHETGREWDAAEINLDADVLPPDESGHGTHVAGVVAGNGASAAGETPFTGMAPEAGLLVVKVADSSGSVADDALIVGLEWAAARREEIEAERGFPTPLVANLSFGGLLGPNDGTSVCDLAISSFVAGGMTVVASAGNEHSQGVHTQGEIAPATTRDVTFLSRIWTRSSRMVASIWYDPGFEMSIEVVEPILLGRGERAIVLDNGRASQRLGDAGALRSGGSVLTVAHTDEGVSGRHILVSMDGDFDPGSLTLRLTTPADVGSGTWHGWIDTASALVAWSNPVESATINSPATAADAIAVASYVSRVGGPSPTLGGISIFSSSGPIRRQSASAPKPDIAAGGEVVVSTRSRFSPLNPIVPSDYEGRTGTSQATPIVAGTAALMLSRFPQLTPAEVRQELLDTAESDVGDDPDRWGAGRVNVVAAMERLALDTEPPALVSSTPRDGATALDPAAVAAAGIVLVFTEPVGGGATLRLDGVVLPTTVLIEDARVSLTLTDGGVIEAGHVYVVRVEVVDTAGNPFITELTFDTIQARDTADVNGDGLVNIVDIVIVATAFGGDPALTPTADVNGDGAINIIDLITVATRFGGFAAPSATGRVELAAARDALRARGGLSTKERSALGVLDALLASTGAPSTALLRPYPNPFNPETWIPFALGEDATVAVNIYDATGARVRRIQLGRRTAGVYAAPGRATMWDGRNDAGERVASGWFAVELVAGAERRTTRVLLAK